MSPPTAPRAMRRAQVSSSKVQTPSSARQLHANNETNNATLLHAARQELGDIIPRKFCSDTHTVPGVKILVAAQIYLIHLRSIDLAESEHLDQAFRQLAKRIPLTYLNVAESPVNEIYVLRAAKTCIKDLVMSANEKANPVTGSDDADIIFISSRVVDANKSKKEDQAKALKKLPIRAAEDNRPKTFNPLDPWSDSSTSSSSSSSSSSSEEADDRGAPRPDLGHQLSGKKRPCAADTVLPSAKAARTSVAIPPKPRDRDPIPMSPVSSSSSCDTDSDTETVRRRASRALAKAARHTTTTMGQALRDAVKKMAPNQAPRAPTKISRPAESAAPTVGTSLAPAKRAKAPTLANPASRPARRVHTASISRAEASFGRRPVASAAPATPATSASRAAATASTATIAPTPLVINGTVPNTSSAIKSKAHETLAHLRAAEARRRDANAALLQSYKDNTTRGNFGRIDEIGVLLEGLMSKNTAYEKMLEYFDMSQAQLDRTVKRIEDGADVKTVMDEMYDD